MSKKDFRLNCTGCGSFEGYNHESDNVVRCEQCGKRHSEDSVMIVKVHKRYERDETGELLEETP